ncbi:XRE family transcriptional regulator [bacterium]|nr:MAG: XRE family transcriptional regulator [bacterium]
MPSGSDGWTEEARLLAGDRLRRTRVQQRLSIRQIAELSKISKTSVLQVESGRSSRRSTYLKVAEAMGLHLDRLVQPGSAEEVPYAIHRAEDDTWFDLADFGEGPLPQSAQSDPQAREKLARDSGVSPLNILGSRLERGRIKPTLLELYGPSAVRSHAGEEHVFVLAGQATVSVGGSELFLEAGESITFWSSEPHFYAPQEGSPLPVRLLSVRVDS